ncbi:hypothetical protein INH39_27950 [Massilia violaceinigra]|uniref:Secreted protein n=1 Tax=Massilia violaceinigra TaxID=2045208 RepID=A0ABY4A371_9BURK|nr:hypothetical protein [Massilia violaceinigra]UOD29210.1 hypothetical protein INH39_27950 [Massilia violaceinigra]
MVTISRLEALLLATGVLVCVPGSSQTFQPKEIHASGLTADQARQVLLVVLKHEKFDMSNPGMWIDGPWRGDRQGTQYRPGYYDFGVVYSNRKTHTSNVQGHFAVNASTGDVWNTVRCKRYGFAGLSTIQNVISARTGKKLASAQLAFDEIGCF